MIFLLMITSVAGTIYASLNIYKVTDGNIEMVFENDYITSSSFKMDNSHTISQLADLIDTYVSEENILEGNTIDKHGLEQRMEELYWETGDEAYNETETVEEISQEMIIFKIFINHFLAYFFYCFRFI